MELNSISDLLNQNEGTYKIENKYLKKTDGIIRFPDKKNDLWILQTKQEFDWVSQIDKNSKHRIKDFFDVKVGVKTTADNVFIRNDWNKMLFECPENEILKPLISQENHYHPTKIEFCIYPDLKV